MDESLIIRARQIITTCQAFGRTEAEALTEAWLALIETGTEPDIAFLAVQAGKILAR